MKVLLTGATGFVGSGLLERLNGLSDMVLRLALRSPEKVSSNIDSVRIGDLDGEQDWSAALQGIDVVIHAAARVHVMHENAADPLSEFRTANVDATLNLARQAASASVSRFIFISSIKANGEETATGAPFSADSRPMPADPYGQSKLEAEQGLFAIGRETGMEIVVIRPPLVYGPGVQANFAQLMGLLERRTPLPFAWVENRRSLVSRDNLVDLIRLCMTHPAAANQVFLVSDGEDLSTPELCRRLSRALGVRPRLLPVPRVVLCGIGALLGRRAQMQRLVGSLQVDIEKTEKLLGWRPPFTVDEALSDTARWYREHRQR